MENLTFFATGLASNGIVIFILFLILIFEIYMFVHALTNKNIDGQRKTLWAIGMILIHPFVAIGYWLTDYKKSN
jgi:hypothetical protein